MEVPSLAQRIDGVLPQTQCTRCGYDGCTPYANAVAEGSADINRCPPGGEEGIARLARISGRATLALDRDCGTESARSLARIDEAACIGCALCLKACPTDAIVGAATRMHTVVDTLCTGCELCVPACPVDCIALVPVSGDRTGWSAWSAAEAEQARVRYARHQLRLDAASSAAAAPTSAVSPAGRQQAVVAALARARAARASS